MKTTLLAITALLTITASARLGETAKQCQERYGTPIRTAIEGNNNAHFIKNGIHVTIQLYEGKAVRIAYTKDEKFTDEQVQAILHVNAKGWGEKFTLDFQRYGWSTKHGAFATFNSIDNIIVVVSPEQAQRDAAEYDKDKAEEIDGL